MSPPEFLDERRLAGKPVSDRSHHEHHLGVGQRGVEDEKDARLIARFDGVSPEGGVEGGRMPSTPHGWWPYRSSAS